MKERISKLIDVKSIITLVLTVVFSVMCVRGNVSQELNSVYLMVISFYFGTQVTKSAGNPGSTDDK